MIGEPGVVDTDGSTAAHGSRRALRVGVIGAGFFSQFHLEGWQTLTDAEVVAICDRDIVRAQTLAHRFRCARAGDVQAMFAEQALDLIDIVTGPDTHADLVLHAHGQGVPVICQKPFAGGLQGARALCDRLDPLGPAVVVHENFRFSPWYREIATWIRDGRLGRLHGISFRLRPGDGQGADAYLARQAYFQRMPRFLIHETAVHFVDTFRFLFGEVRRVGAYLRRRNPVIAGEDAGIVVFEFDDDRLGVFDGNRLNEHPAKDLRRTMGECWVEGEAGVLRLDGDARLHFKPHGQPETELDYDRGADTFAGGACGRLQAHVIAHLREAGPLENTAHAYLRNLEVVEAIYASAASRAMVSLPAPCQ
ncbi:MAG: Gfo/Idh/MocA family oxidoreductase [Burkholderiaceae bacterium]